MIITNDIKEYFSEIFSILETNSSISELLLSDEFDYDELVSWITEYVFKSDIWQWDKQIVFDEVGFSFRAGETKMVIIINDYRKNISNKYDQQFVIKIPFITTTFDYCKREEMITSILEDSIYSELKDLFALCYFIFNKYKTDVYIMQRVEIDDESVKGASKLIDYDIKRLEKKGYSQEEIADYIKNSHYRYYSGSEKVAKEILSVSYPFEIYALLEEFLITYEINDIHRANIGFVNNNPVIIDYSGYHEGSCYSTYS